VRQDSDPTKPRKVNHVTFAGKALPEILLSAINAVRGFLEGVVVIWYTGECSWFPM